MATIIKSVSFQNFYNYFGEFDDNTYYFKEGINIVNADNNMGKSKFFNGILWLLKDIVVDSDRRNKEVLAKSSFHKMASGKAINLGSNFEMGVKIIFINSGNNYTVSKIVQFKKNGSNWKTNELLDIMETINNRDIPVLDLNEQKQVIKKIIPPELMNYALLQGESMETLVDLSSHNGLSSTIEVLAGINNLIEVNEISNDLSSKAKKLFTTKQREFNSSNNRVSNLIEEKEKLESRIENIISQVEVFKTELIGAKEKKESLEAYLVNVGKRMKYREMMNAYDNLIKKLIKEKNDKEKNITKMIFSENSAWLLMGLQNEYLQFDENRINLSGEISAQKVMNNPFTKLPVNSPDTISLKRMIDTCFCEICGRPAEKGSKSWEHMKYIYDRPDINTNKNNFLSFYGEIQNSVSSFSHIIQQISKDINKYKDDIDKLDYLISRKQEERITAQSEFLNVGGSEKNSENGDSQMMNDFTLATNTIGLKEREIRDAERSIGGFETRLKQIEEEIKEKGSNDEIGKYLNFKDIMGSVGNIFNNTKERIVDEILKSLETNANQKYNELTYGNLSSGGKLCFNKQEDGTVQVSIKDIQNGELTGLGTGFQRMKQLSIIMAIISSKIGDKRFDYPFISDAPFSEFGDNFINNFFKIAPNVFTQSIILIKELYDPNSDKFLNDLGFKVLDKMKNGEIPGTFYVNIIKEKADTTNLTTTNKCYKQ